MERFHWIGQYVLCVILILCALLLYEVTREAGPTLLLIVTASVVTLVYVPYAVRYDQASSNLSSWYFGNKGGVLLNDLISCVYNMPPNNGQKISSFTLIDRNGGTLRVYRIGFSNRRRLFQLIVSAVQQSNIQLDHNTQDKLYALVKF